MAEYEIFPKDTRKTYGLMEVVRGTSPAVERGPERTSFSWPNLVFRQLVLFMGVLLVLLVASLLFDAPLEELANPQRPTNPAKAPWYFLGLQELVSYDAFIGGVLIPALIAIFLLLIPYIDRTPHGVGVWFSPKRKLALAFFTIFVVAMGMLIITGTFMRGPNWEFFWPWEQWPHAEYVPKMTQLY